jgi:phosphoglycolate phosphatase
MVLLSFLPLTPGFSLKSFPMKPVHLIIFDLDGTLVNTLEDLTASLNFALTKLGRTPVPLDRVRQYVGDGLTLLMSRALGDRQELLDDARGIFTVHYSRNLAVRSRLYPGVRETLEHFRSIPLAVVTNKTRELSAPLLETLGIRPFFRMLIGADDGLPLKPAPDAIEKILRDLSVPRERAAVVGDGTTDIRAGKAAGVTTCAVTYGFRSEEQLREAGPDHVIRELPELKGLFRAA